MTAAPRAGRGRPRRPMLINVLYHDWEFATWDEMWSISNDDRGIARFSR